MRLSGEWTHPDGWPARVPLRATVWTVAALLATAAALPAVWWQSLHVDEVVVLYFAPLSFGDIVDTIFVDRGGAPLHFFLEHVFLAWPGGVEGLRLPSFFFFLVALPAAGLVAERLVERTAALVLVPALAIAPLAVDLATFGRMYSLFLATTLWATLLALIAAERADRRLWGAAGVALGLLVYVHPIAPLYLGIALLSALIHGWRGWREMLRTAWPAAVGIGVVSLPYFVMSLATLKDRYDVSPDRGRLRGQGGDSVLDLAIEALFPGGRPGQVAFALLGLVGLFVLGRERPRTALVLALWIVVPAAFFTVLPAQGTVFFPRYLLPALPFLLLAVVVGCLSLGRFGTAGKVAAVLAVLSLFTVEAYRDVDRLRSLAELDLQGLTAAVEPYRDEGVLFSSAEAAHLDRYVALRLDGLTRIESTCDALAPYLEGSSPPRKGIWILNGSDSMITRGLERLGTPDDLDVERIGSNIVLVTSKEALTPRELVERGFDLRATWFADDGSFRVERIARQETRALAGECPDGE
jgi:Dolichyl-phosphate-mannose-protein mannosyltransferase